MSIPTAGRHRVPENDAAAQVKAVRLREEDLAQLPAQYQTYAGLGPYLLPLFGRLYWRRLDYCLYLLSKHLAKDSVRLVDLGAGLGVFLRSLGTRFFQAKLVGLDVYPRDVLLAAKHAWFQDDVVQFTRGDIHDLPFLDASLDVVTALDVLEHVADPRAALREIRRVLRPTGLFLVSVPTEGIFLRAARRVYFLGRRHEEGANPHWQGTVQSYKGFCESAAKHFQVVESSFVPFGLGGPHLNYDYIALCHPKDRPLSPLPRSLASEASRESGEPV